MTKSVIVTRTLFIRTVCIVYLFDPQVEIARSRAIGDRLMLFDNVSMSVFAGCLAHQWFLWHKDELGS